MVAQINGVAKTLRQTKMQQSILAKQARHSESRATENEESKLIMETQNYIIRLSATDTELYRLALWRRAGLQGVAEHEANDRGCDVCIVDSECETLFQVSPRMGGRS